MAAFATLLTLDLTAFRSDEFRRELAARNGFLTKIVAGPVAFRRRNAGSVRLEPSRPHMRAPPRPEVFWLLCSGSQHRGA